MRITDTESQNNHNSLHLPFPFSHLSPLFSFLPLLLPSPSLHSLPPTPSPPFHLPPIRHLNTPPRPSSRIPRPIQTQIIPIPTNPPIAILAINNRRGTDLALVVFVGDQQIALEAAAAPEDLDEDGFRGWGEGDAFEVLLWGRGLGG